MPNGSAPCVPMINTQDNHKPLPITPNHSPPTTQISSHVWGSQAMTLSRSASDSSTSGRLQSAPRRTSTHRGDLPPALAETPELLGAPECGQQRPKADPAWPAYTPLPAPPSLKARLGRKLPASMTESLDHLGLPSHYRMVPMQSSPDSLESVPEDASPVSSSAGSPARVPSRGPQAKARANVPQTLTIKVTADEFRLVQESRQASAAKLGYDTHMAHSVPDHIYYVPNWPQESNVPHSAPLAPEKLCPEERPQIFAASSTTHFPVPDRRSSGIYGKLNPFGRSALGGKAPSSCGSSSSGSAESDAVVTPSSSLYMLPGMMSMANLSTVDFKNHAWGTESYTRPTVEQLLRSSELHVLDENGMTVRFGDIVSGHRRTIVIFVRHWLSSQCAQYIKTLISTMSPSVLATARAHLVIIGHGDVSMIKGYRSNFQCPFPVYTDPTRRLHAMMGLLPRAISGTSRRDKSSNGKEFSSHNPFVRMCDTVVRASRMGGLQSGNRHQMGAEYIFDGSLCLSYAHRMGNPADHAPISELSDAIKVPSARFMPNGCASRSNPNLLSASPSVPNLLASTTAPVDNSSSLTLHIPQHRATAPGIGHHGYSLVSPSAPSLLNNVPPRDMSRCGKEQKISKRMSLQRPSYIPASNANQ